MKKYFPALSGREQTKRNNEIMFKMDEKEKKKRILAHLNRKYEEVGIACIPIERKEDNCLSSKGTNFHVEVNTDDGDDDEVQVISSPYFARGKKRKIPLPYPKPILLDEDEPKSLIKETIMGSRWPSAKKVKYSPTEGQSNNAKQPNKIITCVPSTSSPGSIDRALSGINGFQASANRKRFQNRLYKGQTLPSLRETPWASAPTKIKSKEKKIKAQLTTEQKNVVALALQGESFFFTGSAGTGKSFVLRVLVEELQMKHGCSSVFVTASTGMAACNIQGVTLHSFAGIGLAKESKEQLAVMANKKQHVVARWKRAAVLIIDEISMISSSFFSKVEYVARVLRESKKPFGGVQVILCGDFFQLPPVKADGFCFEGEAWKRAVTMNIELKQVIRQKNPEFVKVLNEIRIGKLSESSRLMLQSRVGVDISSSDGIKPTKLYPHRCDVQQENLESLKREEGKMMTFTAEDHGDSYNVQQLDSHCQAPKILYLKKGCQVMLLKNLDFKKGLVNGSRGIVTGFTCDPDHPGVEAPDPESEEDMYPVVHFADGTEHVITQDTWRIELAGQTKASRFQIPLALAYAISIHKSQGMSIERVDLSLAKVFACGQAYVALSRVTSLEGLRLTSFSPSVIRAHPKVILFYQHFKETPIAAIEETESQEPSFWSDEDAELEVFEESSSPPEAEILPTSSWNKKLSGSASRKLGTFRGTSKFGTNPSNCQLARKPILCGKLSVGLLPLSKKSALSVDLTSEVL